MVDRNTLECDACGTRTITRTQIGHGDSQVHAFPCPTCGAGITFVLNIDQAAITLEYAPNPINAHWVEGEDGAEHTRAFATELLIPKTALGVPIGLTPFLSVMHLFRDWQAFAEHEANRRAWLDAAPPVLARLRTHLEQRNPDLFA